MWSAPDDVPHTVRLHDLLLRFRAQEASTTRVLHELQACLEELHRQASYDRIGEGRSAEATLQRCRELQLECDALATELVHVRMAVLGVGEEIDQQRLHPTLALPPRLLTPA
jgi:hypothetical protein